MTKIYFVTTIRIVEKEINSSNIVDFDTRTVGYFSTVERAIECLEKNWGDLNEAGYYPWAVIEAVPEGLYPVLDQEESIFWEWQGGENGIWKRLPAPPIGEEWQNYLWAMPKRWGQKEFDVERFDKFARVG